MKSQKHDRETTNFFNNQSIHNPNVFTYRAGLHLFSALGKLESSDPFMGCPLFVRFRVNQRSITAPLNSSFDQILLMYYEEISKIY